MTEQSAWLIERRDTGQSCWLTWLASGWMWTSDANDAIKFADEKSANNIANTRKDTFPVYVCEHLWPEGFVMDSDTPPDFHGFPYRDKDGNVAS